MKRKKEYKTGCDVEKERIASRSQLASLRRILGKGTVRAFDEHVHAFGDDEGTPESEQAAAGGEFHSARETRRKWKGRRESGGATADA
ncbi:hypothetical protein MRX96_043513 [Rhipicephalus microplus]